MHCMNFFYSSNISVFIYCTIIVRLLCDYRTIIARLPYDYRTITVQFLHNHTAVSLTFCRLLLHFCQFGSTRLCGIMVASTIAEFNISTQTGKETRL